MEFAFVPEVVHAFQLHDSRSLTSDALTLRRSGGFCELALRLQPIVEIMTVLFAAGEKQFVRPARDRLLDGIAARQGFVTTS